MIWALLEILLPLLLLFLLGLIVGWFIWRWRRTSVAASQWNELSAAGRNSEAELAKVSAARDEAINERSALSSRVASLTSEQQTLSTNLDGSQAELAKIRGDLDAANGRVGSLEGDLASANTTISGYKKLEGDHKKLQGDLAASNDKTKAAQAELDAMKASVKDRDAKINALSGDVSGRDNRIGELEKGAAAAALVATQLKDSKSRSGELEASLGAARGELDGAQSRIADLEAQLEQEKSSLDARNVRIAELEGELGGALAGQRDLDAANAKIAELEAALDGEDEEDTANAEANAMRTAAFASGAWIVGTTALGTAGVEPDHVDDLKKIKGIGPKLEGVLNEKGVQTYEQLAALNADEQEVVNGALDAFPGRIYRDEWVPQAQAIMANGHAPLTNAKKADLESANARIGELESDLADASSAGDRLGQLESELGAAQSAAQGLQGDLDGANARASDLEAQLAAAQGLQGDLDARNARIAELQSELGAAQSVKGDLDGANARIKDLEGELKTASAAGDELGRLRVAITEKDRRIDALENAARGAASADDLAAAKKTIKAREARIAELEASIPEDDKHAAAWPTGAWKSGTTKLKAPGIGHSDDLKVISGIGPQMEELLNSFDIKSWEQLADLDKDGIAVVDAALTDFPGRIERDEWVPQAKAIMENGHKPVKRAPKKRVAKKPSWQKGTTKLGTPGAAHKDDLKVVNGIGPVSYTHLTLPTILLV